MRPEEKWKPSGNEQINKSKALEKKKLASGQEKKPSGLQNVI